MRLVVVDDAVLRRQAIVEAFTAAGFEVTGHTGDAAEVEGIVARDRPDVVVRDVRMPPTFTTEGLDVALRLREADPRPGRSRRRCVAG